MKNSIIYVATAFVSTDQMDLIGELFEAEGFTLPCMSPKRFIEFDANLFPDIEYTDAPKGVRVYSENAVLDFLEEYKAEMTENIEKLFDDTEITYTETTEDEPEVEEVVEDEVTEDNEGNNIVTIESELGNIDILTDEATIAVDVKEDIIKIRIGMAL
jgi:hypothetical protein